MDDNLKAHTIAGDFSRFANYDKRYFLFLSGQLVRIQRQHKFVLLDDSKCNRSVSNPASNLIEYDNPKNYYSSLCFLYNYDYNLFSEIKKCLVETRQLVRLSPMLSKKLNTGTANIVKRFINATALINLIKSRLANKSYYHIARVKNNDVEGNNLISKLARINVTNGSLMGSLNLHGLLYYDANPIERVARVNEFLRGVNQYLYQDIDISALIYAGEENLKTIIDVFDEF